MKNYIKIIINAIILLFALQCYSQEAANEHSYWVWRDRLVNDFMVPGAGTGCGIIITGRGGYNYPGCNDGGFSVGDDGWQMGYYLAVLATEWKLLHDAGQPTQQTEVELYNELQTLYRLDNTAESYWIQRWGNYWGTQHWNILNPTLNGFMIRDDIFDETAESVYPGVVPFISQSVSGTSLDNFNHLNSGNNPTGGKCGKYCTSSILPYNGSYYIPLSDFDSYSGNAPSAAETGLHASDGFNDVRTGPEEVSQDDYLGMMIGLCTIIKCIPSNYTTYVPDNCSANFNIYNAAQNILSNIILFMQNSNGLYNGNNDRSWKYDCLDDHCWLLTNPITGMCVKGVAWHDYLSAASNASSQGPYAFCQCNAGGAEATLYSNAFAPIYNSFVGSGGISACAAPLVYDNTDKSVTLYTLSNIEATNVFTSSDFPWVGINNINSNTTACEVVDGWGSCNTSSLEFQFLDLLWCFLNDDHSNSVRMSTGYNAVCFNPSGPNYYDEFLNEFGCTSPYIEGGSNLLPQMLVHNLLKLYRHHSYQFPTSNNITDNQTYPYPDNSNNEIVGTGNNSNSCFTPPSQEEVLTAINTINSTATIGQYNANGCTYQGWVQYVAGEKIVLKPGFKVKAGAYFDAKIVGGSSCQVTQGGDYTWLAQGCQPCTPPYTFPGINGVSDQGSGCGNTCSTVISDCQESQTCIAATWLATCNFKFSAELPVDCYIAGGLTGGNYQWNVTDPNGTAHTYTTSSNLLYSSTFGNVYYPCFNNSGGCEWYIQVNYISSGNVIASSPTQTFIEYQSCGMGSKVRNDTNSPVGATQNSVSNVNNIVNTNEKIIIYPNPTDGIFIVSCTNASTTFSVKVTNVLGETIFSTNNINNKTQFDLSLQSKGVYIVKTIILGKTESEQKLVYQ